MNKKLQICIHIGCAKAASTTLQKQLFDKHSEINNLGIYPTGNLGKDSNEINYDCPYLKNEHLRRFYYNLVILDGIEYRVSDNFKLYKESIKPLIKTDPVNVFSNERFTSVLFSHDDIKSKADRLKEIFPNAKIIMVLRNQFNMIISQYRDWPFDPRCVRIGKPVSLDKWIEIALEDNLTKYLSSLKYYEIADVYSELFGKDNVGLFLFEDLVSQPQKFAAQISAFLDIDAKETRTLLKNKHENKSVSHRYKVYRTLVRRKLFPSLDSPKLNFLPNIFKENVLLILKGGNKRNYDISLSVKTKIKDYFGISNKKLQDLYKLDLGVHDYPLN